MKNIFMRAGACLCATRQFYIYDESFPAGTFIYYDRENRTAYFCTHFPNYNGNPANVTLNLIWYDLDLHEIGSTVLKRNYVSNALFKSWKMTGCPRIGRVYSECNYERMMSHERKKKAGTGGTRITKYVPESRMQYKQVTESAYWANLNSAKSGNASVVAAGIR